MERRPHRRPAPVFGGNSGRNAGGNVCARILYEQERGVCPLCAAVFGGGQAERRQESEAGSYGQQSAGQHCGGAVRLRHHRFRKIHHLPGRQAGPGHRQADGGKPQPAGDQGRGVLRHGLPGRIPEEHRQRRKYAQPDPGLHRGRSRARTAEDKLRAENEALRREAAALREQLDKLRRHKEKEEKEKEQEQAEG